MTTPLEHLSNLIKAYPVLVPVREQILDAYTILHYSLAHHGKVYLCGNGGSAADCDHWAAEMLKSFAIKRKTHLGDAVLEQALPFIPLTGFNAFHTAWANDCDPRTNFAQLVCTLCNEGDVLIAITTSGNSDNILLAVQAAKQHSVKVIGLTGRDGGKLALFDSCQPDCIIIAPAMETYKIQELHLPIYHCLSMMLEVAFFGGYE